MMDAVNARVLLGAIKEAETREAVLEILARYKEFTPEDFEKYVAPDASVMAALASAGVTPAEVRSYTSDRPQSCNKCC